MTGEIPGGLVSATEALKNTPEAKYEQAYADFLRAIQKVPKIIGDPYNSYIRWHTEKVDYEVMGEEFEMWMEEVTYAENGGSNEEISLKIRPKQQRFGYHQIKQDVFSWSNSKHIQTSDTIGQIGTSLKDPETIRGLIEVIDYLKASLESDPN